MSLASTIKSNPGIKRLVHSLIVNKRRAEPWFWIKWFINPFVHKRGKGTVVKHYARLDVYPFNDFSLGSKTIVEDFVVINNGVGAVSVGDNVGIGLSNVIIGPVTIGNYVMLAQNIVISGLNHGFEDITLPPRVQKVNTKPIIINDNVWIGANSSVTAGVTIGKNAIIGAGSVVTKNIPEYSVAVGNPAKVIKRYNFETGSWERV